ncbi:hypothetical protein U1Q18_040446 [Sarracenia purpurea var. burkii]
MILRFREKAICYLGFRWPDLCLKLHKSILCCLKNLARTDALLEGVNYASGGAGILNDIGLYFIQRLSFDDQIKYFKKKNEAIKMKIGEDKAEKLRNEVLYFIGIATCEIAPIGCKKDGVPWAESLGMHSFPEGEIQERAMLKPNTYQAVLDLINYPHSYGKWMNLGLALLV